MRQMPSGVEPTTAEVLRMRPTSPFEVADLILAVSDKIADGAFVLNKLTDDRYAAEEAYSNALATKLLDGGGYVLLTDRRAWAKLQCNELLHEVNMTKALQHHAERLNNALERKLSGLQTINRSNTAAVNGAGGGA
jgi:hypothetical protein